MKSTAQNANSRNATSGAEKISDSAETTLRLISQLPVPKGLEDRVTAGLKTAPRTARVLHWPASLQPTGSWMRGAAAAAIVFVVAGGGWGIYTRVQPPQTTKVFVMPRAGAGGGFSTAGAMRTPQTVNGPVVAEPVAVQPIDAPAATTQPAEAKPLKKVPAKIVPMRHSRSRSEALSKVPAQPAVSVTK
jgi:hypothetical protein